MGKRYHRNRYFEDGPKPEIQNEKVEEAVTEPVEEPVKEDKTTKVRVSIDNLNIRKGPGKDYDRTGKFTGVGEFVIVETKEGPGSDEGWGKLESGGWISLHFCEVIK